MMNIDDILNDLRKQGEVKNKFGTVIDNLFSVTTHGDNWLCKFGVSHIESNGGSSEALNSALLALHEKVVQ